ncbi:MAG: hypothetical protein ACXVBF_09080, partial [Flavisolibacter sp.]
MAGKRYGQVDFRDRDHLITEFVKGVINKKPLLWRSGLKILGEQLSPASKYSEQHQEEVNKVEIQAQR